MHKLGLNWRKSCKYFHFIMSRRELSFDTIIDHKFYILNFGQILGKGGPLPKKMKKNILIYIV